VVRYQEHYRSAANPTAKSYKDMAFSKHYKEHHLGQKPKLSVKILKKQWDLWSGKLRKLCLSSNLNRI
jgi:hypothetical protein